MAKRLRDERVRMDFLAGRSVISAAARVASEHFDECFENELASHLNET